MRFAGARLFVASCEGSQTTATVRTISDTNEVITLKTNAAPKAAATFSTDTTGSKVFVIGGAGDGEIHSVPANNVTPIASNVLSGVLLPDGSEVVYTTTSGSLLRATTSAPITATTLVASGAREVLLVSPDGKHAIVASNDASSLHDLHLASLASAASLIPLVTTPSGVPIGWTKSQAHFLYMTDVSEVDSTTAKVRAHAMASGKDITVGTNVTTLALIQNETKAVVAEATSAGSDVKIVDLDTGSAAPLLSGAFTATAYQNAAYYSVGFQGLYAVDLD
jgi:hypothetical protein